MVALRKESVDRNPLSMLLLAKALLSLSARRAWIEIECHRHLRLSHPSLSARRAWIEIPISLHKASYRIVALRKESVDRNIRPPPIPVLLGGSLSARRAWIEI